MADLAWILAGILGLWLGTEAAVRAGSEIGRVLGLSEMFLGLTVFAIGTDLSELIVAIEGAQRLFEGAETSGLIVGNALGSTLAQGGLVLGVLALFGGLRRATFERHALRDAAGWVGATAILILVSRDGEITRSEGGLLVLAYAIYLSVLLRASRALGREDVEVRRMPLLGWGVLLVGGLALVVVSAEIAIEHGIAFATRHEVSPTAIGLFGIGVGTSLPELAVSIGALARGRPSLSLGNVLGSNTFDLLIPLGVGALIHPIEVERSSLLFDLPAVAVLAVYFAVRLWCRGTLGVRDALGMFIFYTGFVLFRLGTFVG